MKRIKVVHLDNLDVGLKVHLGNYMRYLQTQGYDVSAVCPPGRWLTHDTTILDGIRVKVLPFEPRITPFADLKTLARLIRYFRREQFDIVHTHTVKPGLLGRLAARLVGVPVIIHTVHGLYLDTERMSPLKYRFFWMVERIGSACSHFVLSQNRQDIDTIVRAGICPRDKIGYLGNGIDLSRFDPDRVRSDRVDALRDDLEIPPDSPVVGFVGRLVREKGICEFIEAAGILKSNGIRATYLIVGTPQEGKQTTVSPERLVRTHGLESDVVLAGYRSEIPELLSLMDIVVLPSYGIEGIPRVLMESAAMGRPVVATHARGNVETVVDGKTGLLVPVRDARAVSEALLRLLREPAWAAELGRQARRHALSHFDERSFFLKTDEEYRRLLRARLALDPERVLRPVPNVNPVLRM